MKLRIHHFFDIMRDLGNKKEFTRHPYMHSYHLVARKIIDNPDLNLEMVICPDAVCENCIHLTGKGCDDIITHRSDFRGKEEFNNWLDRRIMDKCMVRESDLYTPAGLILLSDRYLDNIFYIYEGNDQEHTSMRKNNVMAGICEYKKMHGL
jgi:hypothetical protein